MPFINIPHADLRNLGFKKGSGGQWYQPNESSDFHVHLIGMNSAPGYDPTTNPGAPEVLMVKKVELKVSQSHRWWGEIQDDGTFKFDSTKIAGKEWGAVKRHKAAELLKIVPGALIAS